MKTVWMRGLKTQQQKDERRTQVLTAAKAFEVLTGILQDKIGSKEGERNKEENYGLPGYPFYQADASGYIRALKEVLSIIELKE